MPTRYTKPQQKSRPLITEQQYLSYRLRLKKGKEYILAHGGWDKCDKKILDKWHLMDDDCLTYMQHVSQQKTKQLAELKANTPIAPQIHVVDPEIPKQTLKKKGYIELATGSYFKWIEKEWFEKYKKVLKYQPDGSWIPSLNNLQELESLNVEYEIYQKQKIREEYAKKMADKQREEIQLQVRTKQLDF